MSKVICGIYKIENKINGKIYIGQSINIHRRWNDHKREAKKNNTHLYKAFNKYGLSNFDFSIIEECSKKDLNKNEKYWINYYNSIENGYNKEIGGTKTTYTYRKLTKKEISKIINLLKNTKLTQKEISSLFNISPSVISHINTGTWGYEQKINENFPIRKTTLNNAQYNKTKSKIKKEYRCIDCGKIIYPQSTRCKNCEIKRRYKNPPISKKELKQLIKTKSFLQIGKQFNVSDNTIRKWCKKYNLPYKKYT